MKVFSVQNTGINNIQSRRSARNGSTSANAVRQNPVAGLNNSPSFTGGPDIATGLIDFWAAVARGGHAASFTIQDMLGTNFPRTFAALDRNKDITGKNNYKAAIEVMIREFTTGPSMFIIPAIVLAAASKTSGDANRVPVDNISNFSEIMKGTVWNLNKKEFKKADFANMSKEEVLKARNSIKKAFYEDVFKSIFDQYDKKGKKVDINEYVNLMMKAESPDTPKRNFFMSMFNKKVKINGKEVDSKDEIISNICSKFVADKKAHTKDWGNFIETKVVKNGKLYKINDILTDMKNYSDDFATQFITAQSAKHGTVSKNTVENFVRRFKDMRIGSRCITNVMMVIATGLFMSIIPKLYTRNETNPETDAIYAKVNKDRKGAAK